MTESNNKPIIYVTEDGYVAQIEESLMLLPEYSDAIKYYLGYIQIPKKIRESRMEDEDDLLDYYENIIEFFPDGVSYAEEFPDYDLVGFDTAHGTNLQLPEKDVPPELIRNTVSSTQNDPSDLKTYKTQAYVRDVLKLASAELVKQQNEI